jgi:hypothetical protein
VSYTETIYPPAFIVEHDKTFCKYWRYGRVAGGALYRDVAVQRCYEGTI